MRSTYTMHVQIHGKYFLSCIAGVDIYFISVYLCELVAMYPLVKVWDGHDCVLHASLHFFVPFTCKQPIAE